MLHDRSSLDTTLRHGVLGISGFALIYLFLGWERVGGGVPTTIYLPAFWLVCGVGDIIEIYACYVKVGMHLHLSDSLHLRVSVLCLPQKLASRK